MLDGIRLIGS